MKKIRVMIVDDHNVVRDGLQTLIETKSSDIEVVGTVASGEASLKYAAVYKPDVILMDLRLPGISGVEATRQIRLRFPNIKILILTSFDDKKHVTEGMRAGANGYLLKDASWPELESAIHTVYNGGVLLAQEAANILINQLDTMKDFSKQETEEDRLSEAILSTKEKEILKLVALGLDNRAIAKKVFLSEGTVRNYVSRIYELIGVHDRAQAVVWAIRHGLVDEFSIRSEIAPDD